MGLFVSVVDQAGGLELHPDRVIIAKQSRQSCLQGPWSSIAGFTGTTVVRGDVRGGQSATTTPSNRRQQLPGGGVRSLFAGMDVPHISFTELSSNELLSAVLATLSILSASDLHALETARCGMPSLHVVVGCGKQSLPDHRACCFVLSVGGKEQRAMPRDS